MEKRTFTNRDCEPIIVKKKPCYSFFKRLFDIFCSFLAIILLFLVLVIVGLLVKCTSKGPIFFKDKRIGYHGKTIYILKFRSMYIDAETRIKNYLTKEEYERWLVERKLEHDPRVTKFGKFIRKTSLDELPQLFNIFVGTISIIGPRPITQTEWDENFTIQQKDALLSVKPGLSGCWAAYKRNDATYETGERQRLELDYLNKRSLLFDLKLIFMTIGTVIKRKGAQ